MNCAAPDPRHATAWDRLINPEQSTGAGLRSPHLAGKRVLITGAGGSIGSAMARSAARSAAESLLLLDSSEGALYSIDRRLRELGCDTHRPVLGSVCDRALLAHLFETHRPHIVLHAAALKHVPLMEQNPFAAITTNAIGTFVLAETAAASQAEHLLMVSTDKAVDPRSIMGASKRIAELVILALGHEVSMSCKAVRLGNVACSQGSVIPLFVEQIANGGPVTVTHREVSRYFTTMADALGAIFAALEHPVSPVLLLPDLGQPVHILELARHLLRLHASEAAIEFTGLRPGEKLTESLVSGKEHLLCPASAGRTTLREIRSITPDLETLRGCLSDIGSAAQSFDLLRLLSGLRTLVPEYQPGLSIQTVARSAGAVDPHMQEIPA